MDIEEQLKTTYEKIGRNVYNYQILETGLKLLISRCIIHGNDPASLRENTKKNIDKQTMKTMGNLVKEYLDRIYEGKPVSNNSKILMQFTVEADEKFILDRKKELEKLVEQRNHLVHQRLIELDRASLSSCKKLCSELDEQNEQIKCEFEILRGQALSQIEMGNYIKQDAKKFM